MIYTVSKKRKQSDISAPASATKEDSGCYRFLMSKFQDAIDLVVKLSRFLRDSIVRLYSPEGR